MTCSKTFRKIEHKQPFLLGTNPVSFKIVSTQTTRLSTQQSSRFNLQMDLLHFAIWTSSVKKYKCWDFSFKEVQQQKKALLRSPTHYSPKRHSGLLLMRLKSTWKEQDMNRLILARINLAGINRFILARIKFHETVQHNTFGPNRSLMLSIPYRIIVGLNEETQHS